MHIDARLPSQVEIGAQRRRAWDLEIIRSDSGFEDRTQKHAHPLLEFNVSMPLSERDGTNYQVTLDAFDVTGGGRDSFEFKDWAENTATAEPFGTGDGAEDTFQLIKTRTFGGQTFERTIQRPDTSSLIIYADGVEVDNETSPPAYTVDGIGQVIFETPPGSSVELTWSGGFFIPVRFDMELTLTGLTPDHDHIDTFTLVEVKLKASDFA